MKKTLYSLITLMLFIGCEKNTISYQETVNDHELLSKFGKGNDEYFPQQLAVKFITQAEEKIYKATEKTNQDSANVDLTSVYDIISEADSILLEAKAAYNLTEYSLSIELAKAAKKLASFALETLDDIIELLEDNEEDFEESTEFLSEYKIGDYTKVKIEANFTIPDSVLSKVEEFAIGVDSTSQADLEIKLKLKLTDNGLFYDLKIDGNLPQEYQAILDQLVIELNQIFDNSKYEEFEVEIEIEFELPDSDDEGEDNKDNEDGEDDNGNDSANADQAVKFIEQAQFKIDQAEGKYDKAFDKSGGLTTELEAVLLIIDQAKDSLITAINYNDNLQFTPAINAAKSARELASSALYELELILDLLEEEDGDSYNADQALKFIDQAQKKINKATEKADDASDKADVSTVYSKINEAATMLQLAIIEYNEGNYDEAANFAKEAKELVSDALELLEEIMDNLDEEEDEDEEDNNNGNGNNE